MAGAARQGCAPDDDKVMKQCTPCPDAGSRLVDVLWRADIGMLMVTSRIISCSYIATVLCKLQSDVPQSARL